MTSETGAPTDLTGGMPATPPATQAPAADSLASLEAAARATLAAVADHLIPAAHGMPSAAEVVTDERLRFVLDARPDLVEPLHHPLRPELGSDPAARLEALGVNDATSLASLQLTIVAAYYSDARVRELIGYPGQLAVPVDGEEPLLHVEPELIENLRARGPVWRDPRTGVRATPESDAEITTAYDPATHGGPEGGTDGRDRT